MLWVLCIVAKRIKYQMSNIKKSKDYNALYVHTPHGLVAIFWNSTNWWMSRTKNAKITTHMAKVHMLWPKEPTSWSTSPMHSSVYIVFITESVELLMVRDYFGILYCKICGKMNKDHSQEYKWWMPKTKKSNIIMPPPRTTTSWPKIT